MNEKAAGGTTTSTGVTGSTRKAARDKRTGQGTQNDDTRKRPAAGTEPAAELLKSSPNRQVWLAKTRIARRHRIARARSKNLTRLSRHSLNAVLTEAYRHVQFWQLHDMAEDIEAALRRTAPVALGSESNLFLILVRSALPKFDKKQASKWASALAYADLNSVPSRSLPRFLYENGGVEGAARKLTPLSKR